jgi:XTP/dITP diphosphohydrolase
MEGSIATERHGEKGFGYDPVFIPEGYACTAAQLSETQKNAISHRGKALRAMAAYLHEREH